MTRDKKILKMLAYIAIVAICTLSFAGCDSDGSSSSTPVDTPDVVETPVESVEPTVSVTDSAGVAIEGAIVYAIPAADVAELAAVPLTLEAGNYDEASLNVDEPLEDLINANFTPVSGGVANYVTATTNADGEAVLAGLAVDATEYFIYVAPATANHLPGGSLSRKAVTGASLTEAVTAITISATPSAEATYVGSSTCLLCHTDYKDQKKTAHKHGIMATGQPSGLQDLSNFDADDGIYDYMLGVDMFTTEGTTVWFYNYNGSRGFDKFETSLTEPTAEGDVVYATVRAYQDATDSKYYMQFTNIINPDDANNGMIRETMLTYGGGVYKQRYMTSIEGSESLYILPLQFQPEGDEANTDRTRKVYRDYHLDFWMTVDAATPVNSVFKSIPEAKRNFDINCASCHFTGFNIAAGTLVNGEHVASAVEDPNGTMHPLTGVRQELNVGCETCHGPGSEHLAARGGLGVAIVTPGNLTASRESVICGQCHARAKGNDSFGAKTDATLNKNDKMMLSGISRAAYLLENTSRDDANTSDFWADGIHSKSHHQQYTDFIKSTKYRNGSSLLTCTSCHDVHAPGTDRHQLSGVSDNSQCLSCHTTVVSGDHQLAKTGSSLHAGGPALCIECHNVKTAKSGAGSQFLGAGDISSHVFDVPVTATDAMPTAYLNSCLGCHSPL
ncbi:MAG: hypothetical protein RQ722_07745 [Desulfuromonadales bacterium]|nr:hypothetical protein [Desulfuromonadales bacterium]